MRQRNTWTHDEDDVVAKRMRQAIADGESLRDVAEELAYTLPHSPTSILQRWYNILSDKGERVKGRTTRVPWNTRFKAETVALIRAMSDVLERPQNDIVEEALRDFMHLIVSPYKEQIWKRQKEILEAMK